MIEIICEPVNSIPLLIELPYSWELVFCLCPESRFLLCFKEVLSGKNWHLDLGMK